MSSISQFLKCLFLVTIFLYLQKGDAARILAWIPTPSISHQVVYRPIMKELARRGHEITIITTDPEFKKGGSPTNLTEIDVHDLSYDLWTKSFHSTARGGDDSLPQQIMMAYKLIYDIVDNQLDVEAVKDILTNRSDKFDLVIIETWVRAAVVLSHFIKAPIVAMSSLGATFSSFELAGAPNHLTLYPMAVRQKIYNLSLKEKIIEFKAYYKSWYLANEMDEKGFEMIRKKFGGSVPSLGELEKNIDMLFLNVYPIWDNNRPVPPNVVYMGGIHQKPKQELPKDLKSYLDNSKKGVIYMSFGTNVSPSLLPADKIQTFVKVFSELPYDVLWKWDEDELPNRSKNIKIGKWFPQTDLLRHPKIKLFVTQCGLQSTDEAISAGVPLLGVPILGDQWYNSENYVRHKIGIKIDILSMNEDILRNAVATLINDESYRRNMERLREIVNDQPMTSLERTVWWIEYVIRHKGAKHLWPPGAGISWSDYLELPLVFTVLASLTVFAVIAVLVLYFIVIVIKSFLVRKGKVKKN